MSYDTDFASGAFVLVSVLIWGDLPRSSRLNDVLADSSQSNASFQYQRPEQPKPKKEGA
jgi:hypothetical protein